MREQTFNITENREIAPGIFSMTAAGDRLEEGLLAGRFLNVTVPGRPDLLLKRPFGIADWDGQKRTLTFCYQTVGEGTRALAALTPGTPISLTYPLGNGFHLTGAHRKVVLLGGGVGVFPLLPLRKEGGERKFYTFLGFRSREQVCFASEFEAFSKEFYLCTDDGTAGISGFATDLLARHLGRIRPDIVLACGPKPMFRALKKVMEEFPEIPCLVSCEERMGCGVGACLVCVCKLEENGERKNKRVCRDGPVFDLRTLIL